MRKRRLKVGDTVRVIGYRPGTYAPGAKDELGTEELFQSMVGKCYRVQGFDQYGHVELQPKRFDTVWLEPELVELSAPHAEGPKRIRRRVRPGAGVRRKRAGRHGGAH